MNNILLLLLITLLITYLSLTLFMKKNDKVENFELLNVSLFDDKSIYKTRTGNDCYDKFYSFIYDEIHYDNDYYTKIAKTILKYANHVYNNHLNINSKCGHISQLLGENMKTTCVDESNSMKVYNKHTYGKTNYITATIDNNLLFDPNTFTHISILDYEIYKISDLHKLFYVSSNWSTHKGFLFIHVNDIVFKDPSIIKRNHNSSSYFNYNFNYTNEISRKTDYKYDLIENIKNKQTKNVRKNIINFFFHKNDNIKYIASQYGYKFINNELLNNDVNDQILVFQLTQ